MTEEHPNIALLKRFDPTNIAEAADVLAEDVVWHFFNPRLPHLQGDYVGRSALQAFFQKMAEQTHGTFKVTPVSVTPVGDELLVTQTRNEMTLDGQRIETDVVVVWRIVNSRIAEVWDIPSVHATSTTQS